MKKLIELYWVEFKVQTRIPISLFFTVLFPSLLLFMNMGNNGTSTMINGVKKVDLLLPNLFLVVLFSQGIATFASLIGQNRIHKSWQIYRLKGFKLYEIILSQLLSSISIVFLATLLLIVVGSIFFQATIPTGLQLLHFFGVWLVGAFAIFLIGFLIGIIPKNPYVASSLGTPIMFVLLVISGFMLMDVKLPDTINLMISYLPTVQVNSLFYYVWNGTNITINHWIVVIIWIVLSLSASLYFLSKDDLQRY